MISFGKTEEIEKKMEEEKESDIQNIKNQIKALLKCDICNINFDLNIHMPMVAKCGHTYCKKCIYNGGKKESYGMCPMDNIHHVLGIESCVPNLKLEVIIKEIFNYSEPKIKEKKIICFNHEIKLNNNSIDKLDDNKLFRSNSGNKNFFCHHDEIFSNIFTDKKNKTITNFKINKNKDKKICNLKLYNNENVDVIEESNAVNDDKINFNEENKINDESIDTIPINEDKSNGNISFKDEFNELLNKNLDYSKKNTPKINENLNKEENDIENEKNNNINNNDANIDDYNSNNNDSNKDNNKKEIDKENFGNKIIKSYIIENKENNDNNSNHKNINNKNNINEINKICLLSEIQRNSINFMKKKKKIEIDAIDEIDEYFIRPRTITVSKNIKTEQKPEKNKNIKNNNDKLINQDIKNDMKYEIKKFLIYEKISFKKRKTTSQDINERNRKMSIKIDLKNKSEEKGREKINNIKNNYEKLKEKNIKKNKDKNEKEHNIYDIYIEEHNEKSSGKKYKILSKKIGLTKLPENNINHSNNNSNSNSPNNCKNNSEEKSNFCVPLKKKSSLNSYFKANKLLIKNRNEGNKNNCNFISNEISY